VLLLQSCIDNRPENAHHVAEIFSVVLAIVAVLLLAGLWTPIAGIVSSAAEVPLLVQGADDPRILICLMVLGVSVSLLGPGAFSIDALIFGRQRLDLPDR
jgi:hypothetical protein